MYDKIHYNIKKIIIKPPKKKGGGGDIHQVSGKHNTPLMFSFFFPYNSQLLAKI